MVLKILLTSYCDSHYIYIYIYIGFKTLFYIVGHLDSIASYLPLGLHSGFFRSWPTLYLPSSFASVFLVLSFVSAIHHHTIQMNQATRCNSFTSLLLDVYVWLNMFRASPRPSSGAYNCTRSLCFYRWKEAAGALLVWPVQQVYSFL
jgi:hypothetical protein